MSGNQPPLPEAVLTRAVRPDERVGLDGAHLLTAAPLRSVYRWFVHLGLRLLMAVYAGLMRAAKLVGPPKRPVGPEGYEILLTGTFYADNWVRSHLGPLAMSKRCARLCVVSTFSVAPIENVEVICPPAWMVRLIGAVPARLLTFVWVGLRTRPHMMGGFHLLVNGLVTALVGRLVGSRLLYFCVGGPAELLDGGLAAENRLFGRLETPDAVVERRLLQAVAAFDLVITMGNSAISFFRQRGVDTTFHVVSGGLDAHRFRPSETPPTTDLILVGRLAPIKRVDIFLRAVKQVQNTLPGVTATVVGDGPLRPSLEQLARELGIDGNVTFVGHQQNVEAWLRRAKVFVLTSETEGLSLALIEAMLCGLPAVASQVGDLGDLLQDGVNGYLVPQRSPEAFAVRVLDLLTNAVRLDCFARAARRSAQRYKMGTVSSLWDDILTHPTIVGTEPSSAHPST